MPDVTIIGGGSNATTCAEVLNRADFSVRRTFELDDEDRSPIILGEVLGAFSVARQALDSGRHLLVANPNALSPERLSLLLENRRSAQALFVWSERRHHPAYRFLGSLIEADTEWRPRYVRQDTLSSELTNAGLARWLTLEALALLIDIAGTPPLRVAGTSVLNPQRHSPDLISLKLHFGELEAHLHVALGEAVDRRETLLAAQNRKAYIDELNSSTPIRLVEEDRTAGGANASRWLSCAAPSEAELARQQCVAFFDATNEVEKAQAEAMLWDRALASLDALEHSIAAAGAPIEVTERAEAPRFRLIVGPGLVPTPPTAA
jgi:predicted dehydrogenase